MTAPEHLTSNLTDDLNLIRAAWPDMLPPLPRRSIGPKVSMVGKDSPPPAPIAVLSLRRWTCEVLASWCRLVAEERDLRPDLDTGDAPAMCSWLTTHAAWLAEQQFGADAEHEVSKLADKCEAVAEDLRRRRFPVGQCIAHDTDVYGDRVPCTGTLIAYLSNEQALLPVLSCDANTEHVWDGSRWGELGRHVCTVSEASRITSVPERTIRARIEDGSLRPVVRARPVLIRLEDVTAATQRGA